jgi:hypothetical protein
MSIKIGGTEVISNSRGLLNITGANGVFSNFNANPVTINAGTLSAQNSMMTKLMAVDQLFTITNVFTGATSILKLDRSTAGYIPSFGNNIYWATGIEPTWSNHRYWLISFVCFDNLRVCACASGHDIPPVETVTLPASSAINAASQNGPLSANWQITSAGEVIGTRIVENSGGEIVQQFDWITPAPPIGSYFVRATDIGSNPVLIGTLDTWLSLTSTRIWSWNDGFSNQGRIFVEISTTASPTGIVASGNLDANLVIINRA